MSSVKKASGPSFRKLTCGKCGTFRWCESFGGRASKDLKDKVSVCEFCELRTLFLEEKKRLDTQISKLEAKVSSLEEEVAASRTDGCNCTSQSNPSAIRSGASDSPSVAQVEEERSGDDNGKEEAEKKENGKENTKKKKKKKKKKNKKSNIQDTDKEVKVQKEKKEPKKKNEKQVDQGKKVSSVPQGITPTPETKCESVSVFGDSQAKGLKPLLAARLHTTASFVKVACLPGRNNTAIRIEAEKSQTSENSVTALMVSGNDLYLRGGKVGDVDKILRTVMSAVDDCGLKTRRRAVIGMLPRRGPSRRAHMRNISINRQLSDLCTAEGVFFVDPYHIFYGRDDLYQRDGVHLTLKGKAVLSDLIQDVVERTIRNVRPSMRKDHCKDVHVTPKTTKSKVVKKVAPSAESSKGEKTKTAQAEKSGNGGT